MRYFLNGKREEPFPGETHVTVPSPEVRNYAEVPEMMAAGVAQAAVQALDDPEADLIVVNFCNVDVVGHIEDHAAVLRAVGEVDRRIGEVVAAAQDWSTSEMFKEQMKIIQPVFTSEDAIEGATAFAEKRAPNWKGK